MQKLLILILTLGLCIVLNAQEPTDTIRVLPESTVTGKRITAGLKQIVESVVIIDSEQGEYKNENPSADLSKMLSSTSGFAFQNYGVSGSSLAHFRGSSPEQFQVNWNGVNVNSPFLGQFDFSLVPASFFGDVEPDDQVASVLQSAGGIGGSLDLKDFRTKTLSLDGRKSSIHAALELSSLYNAFANLAVGFKNHKRAAQTKIAFSEFQNRYTFKHTALAGNPETDMQNADGRILNVAQHFTQQVKGETLFHFDYWGTIGERGIPLQDFQSSRTDRQKDASHRFSISLKSEPTTYKAKNFWEIGAAQVYDFIEYNNDPSRAQRTTAFGKYRRAVFLEKSTLNLSSRIDATRVQAKTNNYSQTEQRNIFGLAAKGEWLIRSDKHAKTALTLALREDVLQGELMPLVSTLSLGQVYPKKDFLKAWSVEASSNYRYPSLNDWYWSPGGNPDLRSENSLGLNLRQEFLIPKALRGRMEFALEQYYNRTTDWIQWLPTQEGFWSPTNVNEVERLGLEWQLRYLCWRSELKGLNVHFSGNLNRSTQKNADPLLYHPSFKYNLAASFFPWQNIKVGVQNEWQQGRWNGTENMDNLQVFDLAITRSKLFRSTNFEVQFSVKNLFDQYYVYRPSQVMPGRHFTIKLNYNKSNY